MQLLEELLPIVAMLQATSEGGVLKSGVRLPDLADGFFVLGAEVPLRFLQLPA